MNIRSLTAMLRTWDMAATIEFYCEFLGFECESKAEGWMSLRSGGARLMFSAPNMHEGDSAPAFTGSLYFNVGDVDEVWRSVKDRARIGYAPETFDYGMREFGIYDNNGYLLQFGQAVKV